MPLVRERVGAGANVLMGGFKKSIALQPVSIEGHNGLNVAAGIADLTLQFDQKKRQRSNTAAGQTQRHPVRHASGSWGKSDG